MSFTVLQDGSNTQSVDEMVQNSDVGRKDNTFHILKNDLKTTDAASSTMPGIKENLKNKTKQNKIRFLK